MLSLQILYEGRKHIHIKTTRHATTAKQRVHQVHKLFLSMNRRACKEALTIIITFRSQYFLDLRKRNVTYRIFPSLSLLTDTKDPVLLSASMKDNIFIAKSFFMLLTPPLVTIPDIPFSQSMKKVRFCRYLSCHSKNVLFTR